MRTIFILMDSLNRNMLSCYNAQTWVKTPNIDRLAAKSVVCDNHWAGSLPCMPARRDLFTGRYNFLERSWGPVEPYDITLPQKLRDHGVFTHITTDHSHYFEIGGENYCQQFNTWDYHRGQEYDPWVSRVDRPAVPEQYYGRVAEQYEWNRTRFVNDEDYSSPRTFASACEWLEANKTAEQFFLMVEAFDPHEPFDCTSEYLDLYNDDYTGPRYDWSSYDIVSEPPEAIEHLRKRYAATLTMNDKWLGKLLDKLDDLDMWQDTLVIFTTDHGHMLGEHHFIGKNRTHVYNELAHIPLLIHLPGGQRAGKRVQGLTQTIDFMPTLLDYYHIEAPPRLHGFSFKAALEGNAESARETALYGYHGKAVNITDGELTYLRAPIPENRPCYHYCAIPSTLWRYMGGDCVDEIEIGRFLKHTNYPVLKIPAHGADLELVKRTELYNIVDDGRQGVPIHNENLEQEYIRKLIDAMKRADAPDEQFERLGLVRYVKNN